MRSVSVSPLEGIRSFLTLVVNAVYLFNFTDPSGTQDMVGCQKHSREVGEATHLDQAELLWVQASLSVLLFICTWTRTHTIPGP